MSEVMTTLGPIQHEKLGITSMHEHILYDGTVYRKRFLEFLPPQEQLPVKENDPVSLDNIHFLKQNPVLCWDAVSMQEEGVMLEELSDFKRSGGSALLEVSVPGLRSNLPAISRLSKESGVHVVATTGLYSQDSWPDSFKTMSIKAYEQYMLREIEDGIENTGIRAGHIKVAIEDGPDDQEERLLKAAAHVVGRTGLSLSVHHGLSMSLDQVRKVVSILLNEGIDPARTIMCHMQNSISCADPVKLVQDPKARLLALDFNKEILDQGLVAGHDCFGHDYKLTMLGWLGATEWQNLAAIYELCELGYSSQVVLATDTFLKILTRRFGGGGYAYLTTNVLPMLTKVGVSKESLDQMTIENPARLLSKA